MDTNRPKESLSGQAKSDSLGKGLSSASTVEFDESTIDPGTGAQPGRIGDNQTHRVFGDYELSAF